VTYGKDRVKIGIQRYDNAILTPANFENRLVSSRCCADFTNMDSVDIHLTQELHGRPWQSLVKE